VTLLVGITGRAGAGKSLVADRLVSLADYDVVSFATPIKQLASALLVDNFGFSQADVDFCMGHKATKIPALGVSMRHLLQTLGTDWGRHMIRPDLWLNIAEDKIAGQLESTSVVVDDIRFEAEAAMIRNFGGLVIHLVRPGGHFTDKHASESGIAVQPGDVVIVNDGSILELIWAVGQALERFRSGSDRVLELCNTPSWSYSA